MIFAAKLISLMPSVSVMTLKMGAMVWRGAHKSRIIDAEAAGICVMTTAAKSDGRRDMMPAPSALLICVSCNATLRGCNCDISPAAAW